MGKITFNDEEALEDQLNLSTGSPVASESVPSSSDAESGSEQSDSDAPEAVNSKAAKAAQKTQQKADRAAEQQLRKRKRTTKQTSQSKKTSSKAPSQRSRDVEESASESETSEDDLPVASTSALQTQSKSFKFEDGRLPTDLFAQAAAEEDARKALQQEQKEAKASLKIKARKRKAAALPEVGSSVTLPRGDTVQHLNNQDTAPQLISANPRARSQPKPGNLIARYSKTRRVHDTAAATKHASDGANTFSLNPKTSNKKKNAWKSRIESVRRHPALVSARQRGSGASRGFVSGQVGTY